MGRIKSYLELIRLPGVFTAHADIVAGALIAGAGLRQIPDLILLLLASSFSFSAGMALNDYFDRNVDKLERPQRPIPSGRVKNEAALFIGSVLLLGGIIFLYFVNATSFIMTIMLALSILSYDGVVKGMPWAAPMNMGLCRYLNLLLSLSILPLNAQALLIPLLTGLYIFGITILSSSEVKGHDPFSVIICLASIVGIMLSYWGYGKIGVLPHHAGIFFCLAWMLIALSFTLVLLFKQTPSS